jgi:Mrp family chromosome partitioning ATPase
VLTPEFRKMLAGAREEFKYVLVDCPPVTSKPAALLLAPEADASIVTIRAGRTRQAEVQSVCSDLRRCGAKLMGLVLVSE